ncbi:GNAT family N-acetyltransferase [Viridibacillus arvi]|uniref:GNAT family N-acetyltransferase n=1 Tax=Viridibacillus arvi TaxID=263475 RepID=UPI0034CE2000
MIKKRDIRDSHTLFNLMIHPEVFPFVRQKAYSYEEFLFITKQTIELEERNELISRSIVNEWGAPIGTINLFDINDNAGFLGTWLGKPYHGQGYNQLAKDSFFKELFFEKGIERIFMKIRKSNLRSQRAAEKLPYVIFSNETRKSLWEQINTDGDIYNLYEIPKDLYTFYISRSNEFEESSIQPLEA